MEAVALPLLTDTWDALPAEVQMLILDLQAQAVAFRMENAVLQERICELEARLGQVSSNSSRPPSSDPPHAVRKQPASPTGSKGGGQPGHPGHCRPLLPAERVDAVVVAIPEHCRHCQQPFPSTQARRPRCPWRHQVMELLPLVRLRRTAD